MKKKIMIISNYLTPEYRELCKQEVKPKNHLWGEEELKAMGFSLDYITIDRFSLKVLLRIWYKSFTYEYIFIPVSSYFKYLGVLKKLHLLRPKLIVVLHHPPFSRVLKYCKFNTILFLSKPHYKQLHIKNSYYFPWGCDIDFYKNHHLVKTDIPKSISFISNGYTNRDNETLVKAAVFSQNKLFYTSKKIIECDNSPYVYHCSNYFKTDLEILNIMQSYDVLVIPLYKSSEMLGTVGLTSFMDAVGMQMPVIVASNSPISELVEENEIGLIYEAGNFVDLSTKMKAISNLENYIRFYKNMGIYASKISLRKVNKQLCSYFA